VVSAKDWPGEWGGIPSGVDVTQIIENLRLTPTQRVEKMLRFLRFVEDVKVQVARRRSDT
jgi:hypothetical protein